MNNFYNIIIEQWVDWYLIADVIWLPWCRTQAKNYNQLIERVREAISLYEPMDIDQENKTKFIWLHQLFV